jgi:hypothetical protein
LIYRSVAVQLENTRIVKTAAGLKHITNSTNMEIQEQPDDGTAGIYCRQMWKIQDYILIPDYAGITDRD